MEKTTKLSHLFIKFLCLALCLILIQPVSTKAATTEPVSSWPTGPDPSSLSAETAIVMDASTGLILYNKNMNKKEYPASITKIMTTLLCLENSSMDDVITFSKEAVYGIEAGSSNIAIDVGEQLTMKDTLYGIMLESANEACLGAAEHVAGSIDSFVDMMNAKATELGCKNTHFVNPNGLHDDDHYTTAYDMALISQAAIQNETFREITGTKSYTIPATNLKEARTWIKNHHQMLNGYKYPQYEYDYCIGGKTGYTTKSGHTLVTFAEKDGLLLICVVMRADGPTASANEYTDTKSLLDFGFNNYKSYTITESETNSDNTDTIPLFTKYSALFNTDKSPLYLSNESTITLPNNISVEDTTHSITYNNLDTFEDGENIIGNITYTYDGKTVGKGDIIYNNISTDSLITKSKISQIVTNTAINQKNSYGKLFFIIILISIFLCLFIIYYIFVIRKRRNKYKRYVNRIQHNNKYKF